MVPFVTSALKPFHYISTWFRYQKCFIRSM